MNEKKSYQFVGMSEEIKHEVIRIMDLCCDFDYSDDYIRCMHSGQEPSDVIDKRKHECKNTILDMLKQFIKISDHNENDMNPYVIRAIFHVPYVTDVKIIQLNIENDKLKSMSKKLCIEYEKQINILKNNLRIANRSIWDKVTSYFIG